MGYDLHITRADDWTYSEDHPITVEEWLAFIEEDPDLSINSDNGPYFATWTSSSTPDQVWFDWDKGQIFTKNPDVPTIEKMISIGEKLQARVVGDDGETYPGPQSDPFRQQSATVPDQPPETEAKPSFWGRLFKK